MTRGTEAARAALREALAVEAERRLGDSLVLCRQALADPDLLPDAFNLFGRLCWAMGDAANAIAAQRYVLVHAPDHEGAARDLAVSLGAVRSSADAAAAFDAAVGRYPDVACHHRDPLSLLPFAGMDELEAALERALSLDPSFAPAHAALGNVRVRRGNAAAAFDAYRLAAMLDWEWPEAHLAVAAFFDAVRDEESASRHRREALARKRVYPAANGAARLGVLVLAAPVGPLENVPLDHVVNHERVALHVYYLTGEGPAPELPPHDLVFNAIDEAESAADAIERCIAFVATQRKPVLNDPAHLATVRRSALPSVLRGIAGCTVPPTQRVERERLERARELEGALGFGFPLVARPVDTHRGDGQERLASAAELRDYLSRTPGARFNVSPFVDYRRADGYFTKYRVVVVGGQPYPYHLAISEHWKVHYHSGLMERFAWMREEEERFLRDPGSVFAAWDTVFGAIAAAVGLEYFAVDCARGSDGSVLVFECGPGMLVHCKDAPDLFPYKHELVPRIFAALEGLMENLRRA